MIVQTGFFFHIKQALAPSATSAAPLALTLTPAVSFTLAFMLFFSVVIALFKDIPDTLGDVRAGVRTLSVRWGVERVFWLCIWLLSVAYAGAAGFCLWYCPSPLAKVGLAAGHALMCGLLWQRARRVALSDPGEISACYMFVWKLFYAEYLLIPFLV